MNTYPNLLEELFYGNVAPAFKAVEQDSRYVQYMESLCGSEEKLHDVLSAMENAEETTQLLATLINAQKP